MRPLAIGFLFAGCLLGPSLVFAQEGGDKPNAKELKRIEQRHSQAAAKLQKMYGHNVAILRAGGDGVYVCHVHFNKGDLVNPGLPLLKDLFNVKTVYAAAARFDDDGEHVQVLGELPELEDLQLYLTGFGDKAAKAISGLPKLKHLAVSTTAITDAGVAEIAKLPSLEYLSLTETRITDASVPLLSEMAKLRGVTVDKTGITPQAWAKFQQAHPQVTEKAYWDFNAGQIGGGVQGGR